jgi:hypothetical protein
LKSRLCNQLKITMEAHKLILGIYTLDKSASAWFTPTRT